MSHSPENLLTVWADGLLGALADAGVRRLVVSPGSRSTPFLLAALREPRLEVISVIDERAAGFFALGLARARPDEVPALLCTSGSAPAHYYPAVIEASEAALPLLVLSADRPRELARAGAPQTTDQHRLYGAHARAFADLGEPHPSARALAGMRRTAAELVEVALGPDPGPVQINCPARKPLEPAEATSGAGRALRARLDALPPAPRAAARALAPDREALDALARALDEAERPLLVAGPLPAAPTRSDPTATEAVLRLARERAVPLAAESTSNLRYVPRDGVIGADGLAHWIGAEPPPDLVLELGATPTSGEYGRWLGSAGPRRRFVLGGSRFRDPHGTAERVILGPLGAIADGLRARTRARERAEWTAAVEAREARARAAIDAALDAERWSEVHAVRALLAAMPHGVQLAVGNSLPIRTVDRFAFASGPRTPTLRVLSARGVNGIDGWVAGAAGAAHRGGATVALLGDVTLAHDVGALQLARPLAAPLALVVLDNRGGRIFEELPVAGRVDAATFARFTTPPALDLEAAARAFGVAYARAEDAAGLGHALDAALSRGGATLLHVPVAEGGARAVLRRVRGALA